MMWLSAGGRVSRTAVELYSALEEFQWRVETHRKSIIGKPTHKFEFALLEAACSRARQGFDAFVDQIIESEEAEKPF